MKKIQWYEVFYNYGELIGTRTLATFDNLKQARDYINSINPHDKHYHIDKWENTDNPTIIDTIE